MLQTEKQQLRRYYREARRTLSSDEKRFIDCKISDNLLKSDLYRDAACIFCYVSTSDEIGTAAILEQALTDGKTLCVPLCGRAGEMSARRILSLDELKSGAYGIPEPSSGAEFRSSLFLRSRATETATVSAMEAAITIVFLPGPAL